MAPQSADRLAGFGTSIFTEMSSLAVKHGAVNLGQGFPDFPAPDFIKEAAIRHIREDRNQYALSFGVPRLRSALADNWLRRHGETLDPDAEITVASGCTELLLDAMLAFVNPGDEVIIFEPAYDAYVPDILMAGGTPRVVPLRLPRWEWDPTELRAAFNSKTRAVVLNTPHNPTGKVFSRPELEFLAGLCRENDVLVISDEVYSEITFDGIRHVPIATLPGMRERTVTIDSMGKTFSVTGWKVGWAIAAPPLTQALRAAHQFVTFTNSVPFQEALADALTTATATDFYAELRATYTRRRDRLAEILDGVGLTTLPAQGAYFLLSDASAFGFSDDVSFCKHLCVGVGVAAIPTSAFYGDPQRAPLLARFCFAKRDESIETAALRLRRLRPLH
ncbi:MAG TPA: methionine aminotransferase [Polyangia bacterium]|jgi:aspartate/methionine/tyrosine aminotransferase|nr:methionine aminotransferase [Polyangia bacterium]